MIILDTHVLAELMRPAPETALARWLAGPPDARVVISAITKAALRYGVALLPAGKRRDGLMVVIEAMLCEDFNPPHIAVRSCGGGAIRGDRGGPPPNRPGHFRGQCADCRICKIAGRGSGEPRHGGF